MSSYYFTKAKVVTFLFHEICNLNKKDALFILSVGGGDIKKKVSVNLIEAIKYARKNKIPFLGICFGMQMAVIEFARNILKIKKGVIALGGGAFITRAIKNEVLENHLSFWLNWNIDTLVNRIKNSKKRPQNGRKPDANGPYSPGPSNPRLHTFPRSNRSRILSYEVKYSSVIGPLVS